MLPASTPPQRTEIHPILPLYMVIATAFAGYGLMVALFIPMLIHDTEFFDKSPELEASLKNRNKDQGYLWRNTSSFIPIGPIYRRSCNRLSCGQVWAKTCLINKPNFYNFFLSRNSLFNSHQVSLAFDEYMFFGGSHGV